MSNLAQALAQAGQWERAKATIAQIKDTYTRGEALFGLIDVLSKTNINKRGLTIVQHSWLQAKTRDEALTLLQIVNPFIILKPDLGVAFLETFTWVNNFFKG